MGDRAFAMESIIRAFQEQITDATLTNDTSIDSSGNFVSKGQILNSVTVDADTGLKSIEFDYSNSDGYAMSLVGINLLGSEVIVNNTDKATVISHTNLSPSIDKIVIKGELKTVIDASSLVDLDMSMTRYIYCSFDPLNISKSSPFNRLHRKVIPFLFNMMILIKDDTDRYAVEDYTDKIYNIIYSNFQRNIPLKDSSDGDKILGYATMLDEIKVSDIYEQKDNLVLRKVSMPLGYFVNYKK